MKLTWNDAEEIAWALADKFPAQDPLKLSFPKLHKLVTELENFGDHPDAASERIRARSDWRVSARRCIPRVARSAKNTSRSFRMRSRGS